MAENGYVPDRVCEVKHKSLEERVERQAAVVDKRLEEHGNQLDELLKLQAQNTLILEQLAKQQSEANSKIEKLEDQPKQRWNLLTQTIITTIVSGVISALVAAALVFLK